MIFVRPEKDTDNWGWGIIDERTYVNDIGTTCVIWKCTCTHRTRTSGTRSCDTDRGVPRVIGRIQSTIILHRVRVVVPVRNNNNYYSLPLTPHLLAVYAECFDRPQRLVMDEIATM